MDTIFINNLVFSGCHGVQTKEKREKQNFGIDIIFSLDTTKAQQSDRIKDTVDYSDVREIARRVIEQESYSLIESIAHRIASQILINQRIQSATVTIKKMDIWGNGTPGISVTRSHEYNLTQGQL